MSTLRVAMMLPGLGRVQRGAETAFLEVARGLSAFPDVHVELFGSGPETPAGVRMHQVPCVPRERFEGWPRLPCLRTECYYEELSFVIGLTATGRYRPRDFDVALACTFPWVNWMLQRTGRRNGPLQVFVTQNGDWPCQASSREYTTFRCDGLVCINPAYHDRHRERYPSVLIPNGVDPDVFHSGTPEEQDADARIPRGRPVVLMASALIPSKCVADGVRAVAGVPDAFLVVVGDGPERAAVAELANSLLPGRHLLLGSVPRGRMPGLFRRADVFLHMSREEPFGIVYLEAAATRLPCVAHDGPVQRWVLGDAAFFADTRDVPAVTAALGAACRPAAIEVGERARRRVAADWTWQAQSAKYRSFLLELLATRGRAPGGGKVDVVDRHRQLQHRALAASMS